MSAAELPLLRRAAALFAAEPGAVPLPATLDEPIAVLTRVAGAPIGAGAPRHRDTTAAQADRLRATGRTDAAAAAILAGARTGYLHARRRTRELLAAAVADAAAAPDTPAARREAMRRTIDRLRAQHDQLQWARAQARRHRRELHRLHYRHSRRRHGRPVRLPPGDTPAGRAVRAALSRLGRPYVWGGTGPDRFDCSGLTQWAYARAGVPLERTTYAQIRSGIPVPRGQIRPGDLVFPSIEHVQLAIGGDRVIEAPHAGATVRIARLGAAIAIRRPVR